MGNGGEARGSDSGGHESWSRASLAGSYHRPTPCIRAISQAASAGEMGSDSIYLLDFLPSLDEAEGADIPSWPACLAISQKVCRCISFSVATTASQSSGRSPITAFIWTVCNVPPANTLRPSTPMHLQPRQKKGDRSRMIDKSSLTPFAPLCSFAPLLPICYPFAPHLLPPRLRLRTPFEFNAHCDRFHRKARLFFLAYASDT